MGRRPSLVWLCVCIAALLLAPLALAGEEAPPPSPPAGGEQAPAPPPPAAGEETPAPGAETPPAAAPQPETPSAVTPAPELQTPPTVPAVIVAIDVVGAQLVPTDKILAAVTSKVGEAYSEQQVARDEGAIMALGWFRDVTVERQQTEAGIRVVFRVTENPVISDIQFEGVTVFKPDELRAVMTTKPGTVFNNIIVRGDLEAIQKLYESKGYVLAMVLPPSMSKENALVIPVVEGQIEDVRIRGNTRTKEYVIRRMIRTKPGDIYNRERIRRDVGQLVGSDLFASVQAVQEMGTAPGKVVVVFEIVEKRRTGQATLGFGYSSVQGLVGLVDVTKSNLGGTAQSVTARAEFGGRSSYELYYFNPWIFPNTRLNTGLYDRLIVREAFVTNEAGERNRVLYDERRAGGSMTFGRPIAERTTVYLGFRADSVSLSGLSEEEKLLLSGPAFEERVIRSITTGIVSDHRDIPRDPRQGSFHQLAAEFSGVLGGASFNKFSGDERRYFRAGRSTIATRLLLGTITGSPPFLEQFLLGGAESLRGYRNDRFVGTHMAVLNIEYRQRISQNLTGVLFVDLGDAWGGPTVTTTAIQGDRSLTTHVGYGFGIRVNAVLPLRLDIGFSTEGTETHFGLGHVF